MPFQPGNSGNPAGRRAGQPNRVTTQVRDVISDVLAGIDATTLQQKLEGLQGKDFLDAYTKLAEFVAPKLQRVTLEDAKPPTKVTIVIGGKRPTNEPVRSEGPYEDEVDDDDEDDDQ